MLNGLCMKERCKNAFDYVFEDPMVEIKNLKHLATVQFYQEQFEALMNKVELSEAYAISLFIGGSKDEISMSVRMFKPNTLADVYCLAKMQEATLLVSKSGQTPLSPTPKPPYKFGQLFSLEICADVGDPGDYDLEEVVEEPMVQNFREIVIEAPLISLHPMTGQ
ncbi:hypothetical protein Tco_1464398, partial [Tanacetum coccineum]